MLRAYPSRSEAWELSVAAKCLADEKYDPSSDLEFLKKCPDYKYTFGARPFVPVIADRLASLTARKNARAKFLNKYILGPVAVVVLVGVGIAIWQILTAAFGA